MTHEVNSFNKSPYPIFVINEINLREQSNSLKNEEVYNDIKRRHRRDDRSKVDLIIIMCVHIWKKRMRKTRHDDVRPKKLWETTNTIHDVLKYLSHINNDLFYITVLL